ncbi:MAG: hypothetical protein Q7T35_00985 [Nitrosomonas sp.]|nr:hypothetical protein [Nitrosomonas sp.]
MYQNRLFYNILFSLCITLFLTSCAQLPSTNAIQKDKEIGFPTKISLISLATKYGSINNSFDFKPDNNDCGVIDKEKPENSKRKFTDFARERLGKEINEEQINEAYELVKSGEFKEDVRSSIEQLYKINKDLPLKLILEIKDPQLLGGLINVLDPRDLLNLNYKCITKITNFSIKNLDDSGMRNIGKSLGECSPSSINNTLSVIYTNPTTSTLIKTMRIFTDRNNRSARVAMMGVAKMHGIDISDENIDGLDGFLKKDKPDISLLTQEGAVVLANRYGDDKDTRRVLEIINKKNKACSHS